MQRVTRKSGSRNSNGGKEGGLPHLERNEGYKYTIIGPIHFYFRLASVLGSELFYTVFLPMIIWQFDYQLGRSAIIFWNVIFLVGNAMKVRKQGGTEGKRRASRRQAEQKYFVERRRFLKLIPFIHCPHTQIGSTVSSPAPRPSSPLLGKGVLSRVR